jgi:hypothetical protein
MARQYSDRMLSVQYCDYSWFHPTPPPLPPHTPHRPEAAPAFDFEAARLQGCAAAELEPLLSRLEMNSLVKDMHRLQRLMGGVATPDPTRTAALPAALKCLAGAAALMTSGYDEEEFRMKHKQLAAAAAAVVTASPEGASAHGLGPLSVTDTSNSSAISSSSRSGAALSSAAGSGEGVMSASSPGAHVQQPDALAAVPAVKLITTQQDLQALVRELQQQPQVRLHGRATWVCQHVLCCMMEESTSLRVVHDILLSGACSTSCVDLTPSGAGRCEAAVPACCRLSVLCDAAAAAAAAGRCVVELAPGHTILARQQAAGTTTGAVLCLAANTATVKQQW